MKVSKFFILPTTIAFIALTGCAQNSRVDEMVYNSGVVMQKPKNPSLSHNIAVNNIRGGHETNPLWTSQINNANFKEALKKSLQHANLYHDFSGSKYSLDAKLVKLKQPLIGLNLTVTCRVHYNIKDIKANTSIYDKDIETSYTAKISDAFVATIRLKIANEGAARENIQKLIEDLYRLPSKRNLEE